MFPPKSAWKVCIMFSLKIVKANNLCKNVRTGAHNIENHNLNLENIRWINIIFMEVINKQKSSYKKTHKIKYQLSVVDAVSVKRCAVTTRAPAHNVWMPTFNNGGRNNKTCQSAPSAIWFFFV